MGFIDIRISDSCNLEIGEYCPSPTLMESTNIDDPYAMVSKTDLQPSSSTPLTTQIHYVAPVSQYFLLMDINGVLISTFFGMVGKEKVNSMDIQVWDGQRDFLL